MVNTVSGFTICSHHYPNEANKAGYGQLYIPDSAEATTIQLEK
jgi:hypothetical protein